MVISKLLCRPRPYQNESLASYITRLSESNYYSSINWIFQISGLRPRVTYANIYTPSKDNLSQLSYLTDVEEGILWSMTFTSMFSNTVRYVNPAKNFVSLLKTSAINKNFIKLCPICLQSEPYYQLIWDLSVVRVCPYHQCLLICRCPQCQQLIHWSKPSIVKCKCEFDLRKIQMQLLNKEQVYLSKYIYKICDISFLGLDSDNILSLNHPVRSLSLGDLIKVLDDILHFCGINYISQKILLLIEARIYPISNYYSFDMAFYLLINWDYEFPRLMSDYINYLNSCYNNVQTYRKIEDFFILYRRIFSYISFLKSSFFREVVENSFWENISGLPINKIEISFGRAFQFYSFSTTIQEGKSSLQKIAENLELEEFTLASIFVLSQIEICGDTVTFKIPNL